ncbi:MAG: hypothetical protein HY900_36575 [Deltaproteobacteria bacterium]|nr:hypothetical protein [Deltaproteobacteria bacterium]
MGEKWDEEDQGEEEGLWFGPEGTEDEDSAFRERVELFEACSRDELAYPKIFSELGFTFVDDGCDGYCPECPNQRTCATYPELKAEWEELSKSR